MARCRVDGAMDDRHGWSTQQAVGLQPRQKRASTAASDGSPCFRLRQKIGGYVRSVAAAVANGHLRDPLRVRRRIRRGSSDSQPLNIQVRTKNTPPVNPAMWCQDFPSRDKAYSRRRNNDDGAARARCRSRKPVTAARDANTGNPQHHLAPEGAVLAQDGRIDPVRDRSEPVSRSAPRARCRAQSRRCVSRRRVRFPSGSPSKNQIKRPQRIEAPR